MKPKTLSRAAIYLAAGWSGFYVMGIELLGGRLLAPYFGSSVFVWGALIATFMGFLSIGYLLGGRWSLRGRSLARLGRLLVAEAVLALPIILVGDAGFESLSLLIPDPRYGTLVAATVFFGPTTLVAGMVSPYAVSLLIDSLEESGRSAGSLYFASTLGSAAGTIITSFYLVLLFEIDTIVLGLMGASALLGATVLLLDEEPAPCAEPV